jgi:hypothetical protein
MTTKIMRKLQERISVAKQAMEEELAALWVSYKDCGDPERKVQIKRTIDNMIGKIERKREESGSNMPRMRFS